MFTYNKILKGLMLCAALTGASLSNAEAALPPLLFSNATGSQPVMDKQDSSSVIRSNYVTINTSVLFDNAGVAKDIKAMPDVVFNLFSNANFTGTVTHVQRGADTTTLYGKLNNVKNGYFYVVNADGTAIIHVASPLGIYEVSSVGNDLYKVVQIDQSKLGEDAPGMKDDSVSFPKISSDIATADTASTLDVMAVYTAAARAAEGSTAAMKARVALAVAQTNQAYLNSGVSPRLRLVHTTEVAYTETGNIFTDLNRLTVTNDGYIDNVHGLRNTYGADMVTLIVNNGGAYCGLANAIMATASNAFQVTARDCMTGYYSFGHEFGHLQGARHDTYVDPTSTPYAYGHGYVYPGTTTADRWRTVMAYNNRCSDYGFSCTRLQYFSNPTKTYNAHPMGVTGVSENYRVLNNTAYTVANFRTAVIGPNFNSQFNGSAAGWVPVRGAWAVNSAYYYTAGLAYSSSSKFGNYKYGDITYQARMYRSGSNTGLANRLIIRGNPLSLNSLYNWQPGYVFQYTNSGYFSVWKMNPGGTEVALKTWTTTTAIVKNNWNLLKVVAVGPALRFYINNILVWAGSDASYPTGSVGFGMYRDTTSTGNAFYVDWAALSTTPTAIDVKADEKVAAGVTVPGGDVNHSPAAVSGK